MQPSTPPMPAGRYSEAGALQPVAAAGLMFLVLMTVLPFVENLSSIRRSRWLLLSRMLPGKLALDSRSGRRSGIFRSLMN